MKQGSLFDGSGGFPLAGSLCGIEPVWAAEVEPYPIAVTKSRFPKMKHLGNVCNINGAEIEPVDIITFGSPCQDLSVAGKRAGLKHEDNGDDETTRSGLFMEAVRIIKEMRSATNGRYPHFALWENVPGAFSSNQGEDFRIVLEELIKIVEPTAKVPAPPKGGWAYSDIYLGDGWSLAYRVFDAQYWGVPQRRRRIHLVVDFRGECAGEVLFKPESLRGHSAESGEAWQGVAGDAEDRPGTADREGNNVIQINTMLATRHNALGRGTGFGIGEPGDPQFTISAAHSHAVVYAVDQGGGKSGANVSEGVSPTLTCTHGGEPAVAHCIGNGQADQTKLSEKVGTLDCMHDQKAVLIAIDREPKAVCCGINCRNMTEYPELYPTLQAKPNGGQLLNFSGAVRVRYIVRRLTPTECARLQGFPDKWGHPDPKTELTDEEYAFWTEVRVTHAVINGKEPKTYSREQILKWYNGLHTDSAEYKMWGNGIALPPALYCMQGIAQALEVGT